MRSFLILLISLGRDSQLIIKKIMGTTKHEIKYYTNEARKRITSFQ